MRWLRWSALALATALATATARAAEDGATEPIALRYEAPAACPDGAEFFGQLRARTARVRAPAEGERARALVVRVTPNGRGFLGHLHFEDNGNSSSPRVVEARSCGEVIEALNLSAALAVDPQASTAPAASLAPAPARPVAGDIDAGADAEAPPPSASAPPAAIATVPSTPAEAAPDAPGSTRFGAGVAVEAAALGAFVPSGRAFAEISLRERARLFAPSVRAFFVRSLDVEQQPSVGSADLTWTAGGIDVCPIRVAVAATVSLRPCAGLTAGVLAARSRGVLNPQDTSRPWLTPDVHGRLAWAPLRLLEVELEGGAAVPLVRNEFVFERSPDGSVREQNVYQATIIGLFGRLGLVVRFP